MPAQHVLVLILPPNFMTSNILKKDKENIKIVSTAFPRYSKKSSKFIFMDRDIEELKSQLNDYSKVDTSDISEKAKEAKDGGEEGGVGYDGGLRYRNIEDRSSNSDEQFYPSVEFLNPEEPNEDAVVGVAVELRGIQRMRKSKHLTQIGNMKVKEHFSLTHPSSTVTFAEDQMLVFVDNLEQVVLEKKSGTDYLTAKQATFTTPGLFLTRVAYTMVALLMTGFLFVFCIQILLFLFLGLLRDGGLTSQKGFNFFALFGTLLSLPVFIHGTSQIMVIANTFVIDTWNGSKFMKTLTSWDSTYIDWLSLFVFFGFPIFIASVTLSTRAEIWWEITSMSWIGLVFVYYVVFAVCAICYEIAGCLDLVRYHPKLRQGRHQKDGESTLETLTLALKWRMKQALSGYKTVMYVSIGSDHHISELSYDELHTKKHFVSNIGILSRLTRQKFMSCCYKVLDEPVRQYNVDEVLEFTPFITRSSWNLESIFWRNRKNRFIAIIDGTSAISRQQANSSFYCYIIGTALTIFLIIGILVWFGFGPVVISIFILLYALVVYKSLYQSVGAYAVYKQILTHENGNDRSINRNRQSNGIYQAFETFRISEPTLTFCWIMLGLEVVIFWIIPIIALIVAKNYRILVVFIIMGLISRIRNIFSAPACLQELGSLEGIEVNNKSYKDGEGITEWREKHRLGRIISEISVGTRSKFWAGVFLTFIIIFFLLFIGAFLMGIAEGQSESYQFASKNEFIYDGSKAFSYASCSSDHNIKIPAGVQNSLADFAFLASAAYLKDDAAQQTLDEWFGATVAQNLSGNVTAFRSNYQIENGASAVSYKLFNFPQKDLEIISVRGTKNLVDTLTDFKLWNLAAFAQIMRQILPIGEIWTPILSRLVRVTSVVVEADLKEVSYYKETTAFVQSLKDKNYTVQITGHSLGGGIAMITGAQTEIPSIGVSGPNNMLSRMTFDPPVSADALIDFTFNIVPDRDPVPSIDDLAQNYQRIKCRAEHTTIAGCHKINRSLCEILYTCGSEGRPIPCFCVNNYDFDPPRSINGKNFSDYCTDE